MHHHLAIGLLFVSINCFGSNCTNATYQKSYDKIKEHVAAFRATNAVELADSVLATMNHSNDGDCKTYFGIQLQKGEGLELLLNYEAALKLYHDYIPKAGSLGYWDVLADTYISIARVHEIIGRPVDCLRNLDKAKIIFDEHLEMKNYSLYAVRRSSYHRIYGIADSSRHYAIEAIKYGIAYNVPRSILDGNLLMGITANDPDEAIKYLKNAVKLFLKRESYYGASSQMSNIVAQYIKKKMYPVAFSHLDTMAQYINMMLVKDKGYYYQLYRFYDLKKQILVKQHHMDSAFVALELSQTNRRKSENFAQQDRINEIEITQAVSREKEVSASLLEKSRVLKWVILIVALALASLITLLLINYKKQQKIVLQQVLIDQKNDELTQANLHQHMLLSEIHHRVKNNLQLVISIMTLEGLQSNDVRLQTYLEEITNKVRSISLIHEQLYSHGVFDKINIANYMSDIAHYFKDLSANNESIQFIFDIDDINLNMETALPLGIIIVELLSNSCKHAVVPDKILEVNITYKKMADTIVFTYTDNGPGFPKNKVLKKIQKGLMLIENMGRQLNTVGSMYHQNGAVFCMEFKEKVTSKV